MKKIFSIFVVVSTCLLLAYCTKDESTSLSNPSQQFIAESKVSEDGVLFTYSSDSDYVSKISSAFSELGIEDQIEIKQSSSVTRIINIISNSSGKGLLLEKDYIDDINKVIVKTQILDLNTNQYVININPGGSATAIGCPDGYSAIGTCNLSDVTIYDNCIGSNIAAAAQNHLAVSECTKYQFMNTSSTTTICAKPCH